MGYCGPTAGLSDLVRKLRPSAPGQSKGSELLGHMYVWSGRRGTRRTKPAALGREMLRRGHLREPDHGERPTKHPLWPPAEENP